MNNSRLKKLLLILFALALVMIVWGVVRMNQDDTNASKNSGDALSQDANGDNLTPQEVDKTLVVLKDLDNESTVDTIEPSAEEIDKTFQKLKASDETSTADEPTEEEVSQTLQQLKENK